MSAHCVFNGVRDGLSGAGGPFASISPLPFFAYPRHPCPSFPGMQAETPERVSPAVEGARSQSPPCVPEGSSAPHSPSSLSPPPAYCLCQLPVLLQCLILALTCLPQQALLSPTPLTPDPSPYSDFSWEEEGAGAVGLGLHRAGRALGKGGAVVLLGPPPWALPSGPAP